MPTPSEFNQGQFGSTLFDGPPGGAVHAVSIAVSVGSTTGIVRTIKRLLSVVGVTVGSISDSFVSNSGSSSLFNQGLFGKTLFNGSPLVVVHTLALAATSGSSALITRFITKVESVVVTPVVISARSIAKQVLVSSPMVVIVSPVRVLLVVIAYVSGTVSALTRTINRRASTVAASTSVSVRSIRKSVQSVTATVNRYSRLIYKVLSNVTVSSLIAQLVPILNTVIITPFNRIFRARREQRSFIDREK